MTHPKSSRYAMIFCGLSLTVGAGAARADAPMMAKPAAAMKPAAAAPAAPAPMAPAPAAPAAAPAAPAGPPAPPPEVDTLFKAFAGSWKCETTFAANAFGPGSPETKAKTDVKIKKDLGGFWYKGDFKIKKTKTMPGMEGSFLLSYDTGLKAPVNLTYDSMGGSAMETGPGSTAEKMVFVGEGRMMGNAVKFRETMMPKGPKEMTHIFEADMGKGFQQMGVDDCKK